MYPYPVSDKPRSEERRVELKESVYYYIYGYVEKKVKPVSLWRFTFDTKHWTHESSE